MSKRRIEFSPTDADLREDVRILGVLVGEMLREQAGEELFDQVEAARVAAIRRRETETSDEAVTVLSTTL